MATDLPTVLAALHTIVEYVDALERRVQMLQITTGAIAAKVAPGGGEHLRDEDVVLDVIRPGDQLRVSTTILQEWIDNAGLSTVPVLVKEVRVEDDGTKTLVVGPR
jgi:hypothetical protein